MNVVIRLKGKRDPFIIQTKKIVFEEFVDKDESPRLYATFHPQDPEVPFRSIDVRAISAIHENCGES